MNTQVQMIKDHLEAHKSITPLEALKLYGVYRLSAVIYELRDAGYTIKTEKMRGISKTTGRPTKFAKYIWVKKEEE